MKIDLEELERKARAALDEAAHHFGDVSAVDWFVGREGGEFDQATRYANAASPAVTIALIARIRELEGALMAVVKAHREVGVGPVTTEYFAGILEKGSVLP